jgi:ABC-type polysaccharide/polyol phosphate transport system ATPase subunit
VLAVGDASFQEKCFQTFERFRTEGKTIVLVTHSLGIIEEFADRALQLEHGRLKSIGAPVEVIAEYREHVAAAQS